MGEWESGRVWVWVREPCLDLKINACSLVLSCCLLFLRFVFCFHFNFTGFLSARADELNYLPRGLHTHTRVTRGGARANWICCMKPTKCSNKLLNNCWTNCCKVEKSEGEGRGMGRKLRINRNLHLSGQKLSRSVAPLHWKEAACRLFHSGEEASAPLITLCATLFIGRTMYILHPTLCTPYTAHFVHFKTQPYTLCSLDCKLYTLNTLYFTLYIIHSAPYTLHSRLYTVRCALYTLHCAVYTLLHFTLSTPHSCP